MNLIDLRSDTVTQPCAAMRQAMSQAEVGDDVLDADPTVKKLEVATAEILGKEDAIYLPSGSMSNQVAIRTLTEPGDELATGLSGIEGLQAEPEQVCTNIVMIKVTSMNPMVLVQSLSEHGVLVLASGADTIRAVTHLHIKAKDIDSAVSAFKKAVSKG